MDEREQLQDHEQRIQRLEDGQHQLNDKIDGLTEQIKDGNIRNEENNKYLREQNVHVIDMLGGIQQKKQEAHIATWQSAGKIAVTVGAVVSLVTVVVNILFK